jgi:CheY-like chemotaxis protein
MSRSARNDNSFPSDKAAGIHAAAGAGEIGERSPRPSTASEEASALTAEPRRVLIVEDNVDTANTLSMLLSMRGHLTSVAYSAEEALACAEDFAPDIVLLDIGLPRTNGYELAEQLRANSRLAGLRLIAVTGYGRASDRQRSASAGFDDHLVKPVDLATLESSLAACAARTEPHSGSEDGAYGRPETLTGRGEH